MSIVENNMPLQKRPWLPPFHPPTPKAHRFEDGYSEEKRRPLGRCREEEPAIMPGNAGKGVRPGEAPGISTVTAKGQGFVRFRGRCCNRTCQLRFLTADHANAFNFKIHSL